MRAELEARVVLTARTLHLELITWRELSTKHKQHSELTTRVVHYLELSTVVLSSVRTHCTQSSQRAAGASRGRERRSEKLDELPLDVVLERRVVVVAQRHELGLALERAQRRPVRLEQQQRGQRQRQPHGQEGRHEGAQQAEGARRRLQRGPPLVRVRRVRAVRRAVRRAARLGRRVLERVARAVLRTRRCGGIINYLHTS